MGIVREFGLPSLWRGKKGAGFFFRQKVINIWPLGGGYKVENEDIS